MLGTQDHGDISMSPSCLQSCYQSQEASFANYIILSVYRLQKSPIKNWNIHCLGAGPRCYYIRVQAKIRGSVLLFVGFNLKFLKPSPTLPRISYSDQLFLVLKAFSLLNKNTLLENMNNKTIHLTLWLCFSVKDLRMLYMQATNKQ